MSVSKHQPLVGKLVKVRGDDPTSVVHEVELIVPKVIRPLRLQRKDKRTRIAWS